MNYFFLRLIFVTARLLDRDTRTQRVSRLSDPGKVAEELQSCHYTRGNEKGFLHQLYSRSASQPQTALCIVFYIVDVGKSVRVFTVKSLSLSFSLSLSLSLSLYLSLSFVNVLISSIVVEQTSALMNKLK